MVSKTVNIARIGAAAILSFSTQGLYAGPQGESRGPGIGMMH